MGRRAFFSAVGAVIYFALDSIHVRIGIWKATGVSHVPWAFILVYFLGIWLCAELFRRLERRLGHPAGPDLRLDAPFFAVLVTVHILFFRSEFLLAGICAALLAGRLLFLRRPGDLLVAATAAGLEAGIELILFRAGLFSYAHASLGPLPLWHVPFWASLGLCLRGFFLAANLASAPRAMVEAAR